MIQQILKGEREAYAGIVRKYQSPIIRLCISMIGDVQEAEDAAQEIFIKTFNSLSKFKGQSSFYTWIYRIASNYCLDQIRKKSRQKTQSWDELLEKRGDEIETLLSKETATPSRYEQQLVQEVLAFLEPDDRLVLTLREMQGLSYEEMAESLHCSLDAVKGRLKRARQDFKEKLRHFLSSKNV